MQVLSVDGLNVNYLGKEGEVKILDEISFNINLGESLGLVGISGSGKSMIMKSILGLLDDSFKVTGDIQFMGEDMINMDKVRKKKCLAKDIGIILQNPMTSFDPLMRIERQMSQYLKHYKNFNKKDMHHWLISLLAGVNINNGPEVLKKFPHQLSGGMLQRIMIAIATALEPSLIIADEPTTAIDSLSQLDIIRLLEDFKETHQTSILFISHDIGIISSISDRILLIRDGKVIENGSCNKFISNPTSKYGKDLLNCKLKLKGTLNVT